MKKSLLILILLCSCWIGSSTIQNAQSSRLAGFGAYSDPTPTDNCLPETALAKVRELELSRAATTDRSDAGTFPPFDWPLAPILNTGVSLINYVDLDSSPGLRDYNSGTHTYDGHNGTDISMNTFRSMDSGTPVLAAADGVVTSVESGQFDRNTVQSRTAVPNQVTIRHADGSYGWYLHFRKNSVTPNVGDQVKRGQILGLAGSSGFSSGAHLHFEPGEFVNNRWSPRDPWDGTANPAPGLWKGQDPYMGDAFRVFEITAFTQDSAGGSMAGISGSTLKEGMTQPAVFGANERYVGVVFNFQSPGEISYDIEIHRPDGSVYASNSYTMRSKFNGGYHYWYWTFSGNVTSAAYGTWTTRVSVGGIVQKETSFVVGASTVYPPRFSPLAGKSFRITGAEQQDRLAVSPLGGAVTYSLVNAPSTVSLQDDTVTIGATSSQLYRSAYFQVIAKDAAGRTDTMYYQIVDPSKPFFSPRTQVTWEAPLGDGVFVSGDVPLKGWTALAGTTSAATATRVDLLVDGRLAYELTSGVARTDAQQILAGQGINALSNLGFSGTWNSRSVSNGLHRLSIRAGNVYFDRLEVVSESAITINVDQTLVAGSTAPFNLRDRGAASSITLGNSASTATGYARIQPTSGTTPAGIAIFGYRQNNVLISETAVPASNPQQAGRIYAEVAGAVNTGLAIANPNGSPASINFYFTNASGDLGSGSTTIPANGQIAAFLNQSPFNAPTNFQGTFSFTSNVPVGVVALRGFTNERSEFLMSTLPVVDPSLLPRAGPQVIPDYVDGGGWTTQIFLVNPTSTAMSGNVQFLNGAGQPGNTLSYSVTAKGSQKFVTTGVSANVATGSVRVVPAGGASAPAPEPLILFSYKPATVTVSEAGVPVNTSSQFRMYVESSGLPDTIQTGIALANTTAAPATVSFELTQLDGSSAGIPAATIAVPASGQTSKFLGQIFQTLPASFKGVLRITTSVNISVVGLRTRYNERGDFLITTTSPVSEFSNAGNSGIFPHFADGGGYTTQFIAFSAAPGQTSSGVLRFTSQSGQPMSLTLR